MAWGPEAGDDGSALEIRGAWRCENRDGQGDSCHAAGSVVRGGRHRVAGPRESTARGGGTWNRDRVRLLRRTAGRPGDRGDLQPAAQPSARAVDDPSGRDGQACALRKADRAERDGGGATPRGARPHGRADPGSLHGAHAPAVARRLAHRAIRPPRRDPRDDGVLQLLQRRPQEHPQRCRMGRRRADGHRLLSRAHRAPDLRARAAPGGGADSAATRARASIGSRP